MSLSYITRFKNCLVLRDHSLIEEDLWVRDGKIMDAETLFFDEKVSSDTEFDCNGAIISPGYIDVQINGGYGVDFSLNEDIEAGMQRVSKGLLSCGVTSFCPTIVTSPRDTYHKILPRVQKTEASVNGAGILGVHLEGPFISKEKRGAHPEDLIQSYDSGIQDLINMYGMLNNVSIITLAPELPHSCEVIHELMRRGIKVSLGHSMASLAEGEAAVQAGASFITHLFNAMLPFHHRDPHLVGLLADGTKNLFYGMIADGIHTHPAALTIAYRVNPTGLVLVSDAIGALGLEPGIHTVGQHMVEVKDDKAVLAGTETLSGSIAPLCHGVKTLLAATGCSKAEALEAATLHPAQLLNITDRKGTLQPGTDADFVILDPDLDVVATYTAGALAWKRKDAGDWLREV